LKASLFELIGRVESLELEPTPANTMLRGYSVVLEVVKQERQVGIEEDLDRRIAALERAQEPRQKGARSWGA
jgi:hypothetical protein